MVLTSKLAMGNFLSCNFPRI